MTIYALVDDLIYDKGRERGKTPVWSLISPAGILQGGNPYFVPDFAERFEARISLAVRIGKLGKGIAPRFASRYVEAVAPAVVFVAADRLHRLREEGLPWTSAISYDRCLAIGKFTTLPFDEISRCECSVSLESDDSRHEATWNSCGMDAGLDVTISAISRDNTLKTGDILLYGISGQGPEVIQNQKARLTINGVESLRFNIR